MPGFNVMNPAELRKFIETEISLASTFLQTAILTGSTGCQRQAVHNAASACQTANHFMERIPVGEEEPLWRPKLAELRTVIELLSW